MQKSIKTGIFLAIFIFVTLSCALLTVGDLSSLRLTYDSLFILLAFAGALKITAREKFPLKTLFK